MAKPNTIKKVGKQVVTYGSDSEPQPVVSAKPRHVAGKGPSARGPPLDDRLLTKEETAEFLRCSVSALNKWRLSGAGPRYVRFGYLVRYRLSDLAAFLETKSRNSTSEAPTA